MFEIGNTLREARLRRGLDIAECEAGTKIRAKYLRAMEDEHFDLLPSPAYVRGFLRTYAQYLGLDGQLMNDEYESRFVPGEGTDGDARRPRARPARGRPAPRPQGGRPVGSRPAGRVTPRPSRRRTESQLLWLAIGGVMSVAVLVWMGVGDPSPPTPTISPTPTVATAPAAPTDTDTELDTPEAPEKLAITLVGEGDFGAYVEVRGRDARGPQVFAGTLQNGASRTFRVERSLWVRTYNAEGLRVRIKKGAPRELTG
ncbi:MAG TPA: helix-turn-helix domain-containing protein, partial [Miltoncostaeaceae bacterium]|nr:helix-turn-helix domain-containing protein [Miltoncostaeaceae bacterium]